MPAPRTYWNGFLFRDERLHLASHTLFSEVPLDKHVLEPLDGFAGRILVQIGANAWQRPTIGFQRQLPSIMTICNRESVFEAFWAKASFRESSSVPRLQ